VLRCVFTAQVEVLEKDVEIIVRILVACVGKAPIVVVLLFVL
jgi:hypothetical protein